MSYAHITIDGETILDAQIGANQSTPPIDVRKYLTPGQPSQPGVLSLLSALGFAIKSGKDITADVHNRTDGYTLTVDHARVVDA